MKRITLSLAVMAIAAASCQKPEAAFPVAEQFTATVESFESPTKTSMTPEKYVVWSHNDRLAIFQGSTLADEYRIDDASAGKANATFNKETTAGDGFYAGTEVLCNVALYPYAESLTLIGTTLEDGTAYKVEGVVLSSEQVYAAGSFADGAFPMVAVTDDLSDHNLKFKNVLGTLKLQLKGTQTVKSIKVTGRSNEILSGTAVVTAYTNGLTPAITMTGSDDASKSVTLNCGDGIQLNEGTATAFIISLPPVLFTQGFTVTVTESNDETYTIETDKANTVLRSSILTMPAFTLNATGGGTPEEDDDVTYIEHVFLNKTSLTMMPNTSYTLVADIDPVEVTYPTLTWSSTDNSVAEVDQNGKVTAKYDGNVTITALAVGGESASCSVTVKTPKTFAEEDYIDYIDELGVNHGKGIAVAGVIWAPVNCGYEPATADYKGYLYGKLYQWGRKHGQGYDSNDASYPSGENLIAGPVIPSWGSSETYKDAFFYGSSDWCNPQIDHLWMDSEGKKTQNDPCPDGWRIPTYDELNALIKNYSWSTKDNQNGSYFVGEYTYIEGLPQVFFPAAGYRYHYDGDASNRDFDGLYWSSRPSYYDINYAYSLGFGRSGASMNYFYYHRALGHSVRCVQVTDEVAEL